MSIAPFAPYLTQFDMYGGGRDQADLEHQKANQAQLQTVQQWGQAYQDFQQNKSAGAYAEAKQHRDAGLTPGGGSTAAPGVSGGTQVAPLSNASTGEGGVAPIASLPTQAAAPTGGLPVQAAPTGVNTPAAQPVPTQPQPLVQPAASAPPLSMSQQAPVASTPTGTGPVQPVVQPVVQQAAQPALPVAAPAPATPEPTNTTQGAGSSTPAPAAAAAQVLPPTSAPAEGAAANAPAQASTALPPTSAAPASKSAEAPTLVDALKNTIVKPDGTVNQMATDVHSSNIGILRQLIADGKVTPRWGQQQIDIEVAARDKKLKDAVAMQEQMSNIQNKDWDTRTKQVALHATVIEQKKSDAFMVMQAVKSGDLEYAQRLATSLQLPVDVKNPQQLVQLQNLASTSKEFKDSQAEARAQSTEDRAAAKDTREATATSTKDLPDGYFRKTANDPQVYKMAANGQLTPVSTDEVQAAAKAKARAGASTTSIVMGGQKKFSEQLGDLDAKNLVTSETRAQGAVQTYATAKQLIDLTADPSKVIAGPWSGLARAWARTGHIDAADQQALDTTAKMAQSMAQTELTLAQQNKGQGAFSNTERALLSKAAAGNLDVNSASEVNALARVLAKNAQNTISVHNEYAKTVGKRYPGQGVEGRTLDVPPDIPTPGQLKTPELLNKWGAYGRQ